MLSRDRVLEDQSEGRFSLRSRLKESLHRNELLRGTTVDEVRLNGVRREREKLRAREETYLVFDILETDWEIDSETDKDNIRFGIRQGSQSIVFSVKATKRGG